MANLSKEGYIQEMIDVRNKLIDFLEKVNTGNLSYIKEISLKLRILYCFKSDTKSLIKEISDLYNFDLLVYVTYNTQELVDKGLLSNSLEKGLIMEQINSVVCWFERGNELVDIFTAINKEEVLINGQRHSYKRIFEVVADKMGGAHIDKKVNDEDLILHSNQILIGGLTIAQRAIYDTAKASIKLIDIILKYIKSNEANCFIKIKSN